MRKLSEIMGSDFPGDAVVKTLPSNTVGAWVQSLVRELKVPHTSGCSQKLKKRRLTGSYSVVSKSMKTINGLLYFIICIIKISLAKHKTKRNHRAMQGHQSKFKENKFDV